MRYEATEFSELVIKTDTFGRFAMGLDGDELVMEVEAHFGITIQESTAERVRTVGDLVALVYERISVANASHCPSLSATIP